MENPAPNGPTFRWLFERKFEFFSKCVQNPYKKWGTIMGNGYKRRAIKERTVETIFEVIFDALLQIILFIPRVVIKIVSSIFS